MTALWEINHRYHCSDTNYFANESECVKEYKSWQDYFAEWKDADDDMNLIFRWDWKEENYNGENNFNGDVYYRNGKLHLYYMFQRKGFFCTKIIDVCRADEPEIKNFLTAKYQVIKELWEPLI